MASSLVLDLPLNEGSGIKVFDRSQNKNHGTLTGATHIPTWVSGRINQQAVNLDGIDDYIVIIHDSSLLSATMTIMLWVKRTANDAAQRGIVTKGGGWGTQGWSLEKNWDEKPKFYIFDAVSGETINSPNALPLNTWQFIVAVADGSYLHLYENGKEVATPVACTRTPTGAYNINIGRLVQLDGNYLYAIVQGFRFYNRALSAEEIRAIYQKEAFNLDYGLVLHLPLNEGNGAKVRDLSPFQNHGTLVNSPTWVAGKYGKALSFNPDNDNYIDTDLDFNFSEPHTIIVWVNPVNIDATKFLFGRKIDVNYYIQFYNGRIIWASGAFLDWVSIAEFFANEWQMFAFVFDGTQKRIYRNAVLRDFTTQGCTDGSGLYIGRYAGYLDFSWDGIIDEVRIYNRALSLEEIHALYLRTVS